MNPEIKQKWLDALRSGEYVQGEGSLKIIGKQEFCCLGVLCDLYIKAGHDAAWSGKPYGSVVTNGELRDAESELFQIDGRMHIQSYGMPPDAVYDWAGISRGSEQDHSGTLAMMNDGGSSFDEIAQYIETKF